MRHPERALTLTEVVIASAIGVIVVVGITRLDAARLRITEDFSDRAGFGSGHFQAGQAALRMTKSLERTDRTVIVNPNPGYLKVREFISGTTSAGCPSCPSDGSALPACCLDISANYRWDQYRLNGTAIEYFKGDCNNSNRTILANDAIVSLTFQYVDRTAPPGPDNNMIGYSIIWDNGLADPRRLTHEFAGEVTSRAIADANVGASGGDSGDGLAAPGTSDPPADCP